MRTTICVAAAILLTMGCTKPTEPTKEESKVVKGSDGEKGKKDEKKNVKEIKKDDKKTDALAFFLTEYGWPENKPFQPPTDSIVYLSPDGKQFVGITLTKGNNGKWAFTSAFGLSEDELSKERAIEILEKWKARLGVRTEKRIRYFAPASLVNEKDERFWTRDVTYDINYTGPKKAEKWVGPEMPK